MGPTEQRVPVSSPTAAKPEDRSTISAKVPPPEIQLERYLARLQQGGSLVREGSRGDNATFLQAALVALKPEKKNTIAAEFLKSEFGPKSAQLLREVQKELGIKIDGIAGRQTFQALEAKLVSAVAAGNATKFPHNARESRPMPSVASEAEKRSSSEGSGWISKILNLLPAEKLQVPPQAHSIVPQVDPNIGQVARADRHQVCRGGVQDLSRLNNQYFGELDRGHKGYITEADLNLAIRDGRNSGEKSQYIAALAHTFKDMKASQGAGGPPGVTQSTLNSYANKGVKSFDRAYWDKLPSSDKTIVSGLHWDLVNSGALLARDAKGLYSNPANPEQSINSRALSQGSVGNCYFISALGAVADRDPKAVRSMIKDLGNNMYEVTFPGDRMRPQLVSGPTDAEKISYGTISSSGQWAAVLQKAYGQYLQNNSNDPTHSFGNYNSASRGSDGGGDPGTAVELLTGRRPSTNYDVKHTSLSDLEKSLVAASRGGALMTTWTGESWTHDQAHAKQDVLDGLVRNHAYQVMGYDAKSKVITLRNPWGRTEFSTRPDHRPMDGKDDGVFQISLAEYQRRFQGLAANR